MKTFECKEWTGVKSGNGYGRLPNQEYAHRQAWVDTHGDIPMGFHVLHSCDNPCCYNISHLFLGTRSDNMKDMISKGRGKNQLTTESTKGESNVKAKLTSVEVEAIYLSTLSRKEIASL